MNRLAYPEIQEFNEKITKYNSAGETQLMQMEQMKLNRFKRLHGIKMPLLAKLSMPLQGLTMIVWAGLVQRFSYNIEDYPEMLTGGFLWFKDLSISDPYFILPALNVLFIFLNIYVKLCLYRSAI